MSTFDNFKFIILISPKTSEFIIPLQNPMQSRVDRLAISFSQFESLLVVVNMDILTLADPRLADILIAIPFLNSTETGGLIGGIQALLLRGTGPPVALLVCRAFSLAVRRILTVPLALPGRVLLGARVTGVEFVAVGIQLDEF
jgi:hypothetical protein